MPEPPVIIEAAHADTASITAAIIAIIATIFHFFFFGGFAAYAGAPCTDDVLLYSGRWNVYAPPVG